MAKVLCQAQRGSTTIETALVISILLLALAVLIFSFMLMYNQALLSHTAAEIAEEATELWVQDNSLYYRLFDDDVLAGDQEFTYSGADFADNSAEDPANLSFYQRKFAQIKALINSGLQKSMGKPETTTIKIHYENNLLTRRIQVTISRELNIPLGILKAFFAEKDTITLTGLGSAVITDPVGYIRNIDLALEYGTKVKEVVNWTSLREELKERVGK